MYCSNCNLDYSPGSTRCTACMGWLRVKRKPGQDDPSPPAWIAALETSVPPLDLGPSHQQKLEAVLARPRKAKPGRLGPSAPLLALLTLALLALGAAGGYRAWQESRMRAQAALSGQTVSALELAEENLRQAREALQRKNWPVALQHGEAAVELLRGASPPRVEEARRLVVSATLGYADTLAKRAKKALKGAQFQSARTQGRQALALYQKVPETLRQQAEMIALEGRVWLREGERVAALSAFKRAHQMDPKGHYDELSRQVARMPAAAPRPATGPTEIVPEVTLSLGDTPAYPTGTRVAHRPAAPAAASAPVATVAAPTRPRVSNYVPKKKVEKKRNLRADELPSYNDGK